jgi:hypothetical protein
MRTPITTREMQLADTIVRLDYEGNVHVETGLITVKQIKDGVVHLFRPYTATADFSCTSGVICTIGYEDFKVEINDQPGQWMLLGRRELK